MTGTAPSVPSQGQARALGDPTRHEIYRLLTQAGETGIGVGELTAHLGLHHNAVRQHLAKLVAAGLVTSTIEARTGRGRRRSLYRAVPVDAPPADSYERLATWLTQVIASGETPETVGRRAGAGIRALAGAGVEQLVAVMAEHGFEPVLRRRAGTTQVVLGRCPYVTAVLADPATVCGLHLGLAEGTAEAIGDVEVTGLTAENPRAAGCRLSVQVRPTDGRPTG